MSSAEIQTAGKCRHIVTKGIEGLSGSWCIECGEKIFDDESRECKDCIHFSDASGRGICKKHLMAVAPDMKVTYEIKRGTCWGPATGVK